MKVVPVKMREILLLHPFPLHLNKWPQQLPKYPQNLLEIHYFIILPIYLYTPLTFHISFRPFKIIYIHTPIEYH